MREGGGKEERVSSETGKVKAQWKDDLPHHIHTHLSSGQTLKERGRQEHFILELGHLLNSQPISRLY